MEEISAKSGLSELNVNEIEITKLPVVQLTITELKARLEEGEKKKYRRIFIPGRGWNSAKRLQEESQLLEKKEKETEK